MCCGRAATLGYSGITLVSVLWKNHLVYSGITLVSVLWKSYFGLLRDHFGQCAVEGLYFGLLRDHFGVKELLWAAELSWATKGSLWPVCCGRAKLGC